MIGGYLGKSEVFDKVISAFAVGYVNQNERDHELVKKGASKGELEVAMER